MVKYFLAPIVHDEGMYKWWLPSDKPSTLTIFSPDIHRENLTCTIIVSGPEEDIEKIKCDELLEVTE